MDNISDDKIINDNATNNGSNNNTVISRRLEAVRGIMKEKGVDIYVVVTGDHHISFDGTLRTFIFSGLLECRFCGFCLVKRAAYCGSASYSCL